MTMKKSYEEARNKWLEKNQFNKEEKTYIYAAADSFDIKEKLKEDGFKFNPNLLWHCATVPCGYEDKVAEINLSEVAEMTAWGEGVYKKESKDLINKIIAQRSPASPSKHFGNIKERFRDVPCIVKAIRQIDTMYGVSTLIEFTREDDILNWWTSTNPAVEVGQKVLLTATVKKHDYFKNNAITVISRAVVK